MTSAKGMHACPPHAQGIFKESECTRCGNRMAHRKLKETKQQLGTARPGNMLGCCLVSFHFLWVILSTSTVAMLKKAQYVKLDMPVDKYALSPIMAYLRTVILSGLYSTYLLCLQWRLGVSDEITVPSSIPMAMSGWTDHGGSRKGNQNCLNCFLRNSSAFLCRNRALKTKSNFINLRFPICK